MTKNILCAIDISDETQDIPVLKLAAKMAAQDDAQLDLVTVVPDFGLSVVGSFFDSDHHDAAMAEAKKRLNAVASAELGADANAKVRHIVATGKAYEQILKTAKASGTDLIVIGAHAPDLADYLLGPNAARIVRHATCSVYVVR
jgi:nucleotide-binding universal stress UspA family protein